MVSSDDPPGCAYLNGNGVYQCKHSMSGMEWNMHLNEAKCNVLRILLTHPSSWHQDYGNNYIYSVLSQLLELLHVLVRNTRQNKGTMHRYHVKINVLLVAPASAVATRSLSKPNTTLLPLYHCKVLELDPRPTLGEHFQLNFSSDNPCT